MQKRHFQNLISKERKSFESDVKKFKELLHSNEKEEIHIEDVKSIGHESQISDPLASTSRCVVLLNTGQQLTPKKTFSLIQTKKIGAVDKVADKNQDISALLQQILVKLDDLDQKIETIQKNQQILSNGQATLATNQETLAKKMEEIAENLTLKPEMMAQTKALMECKVSIKRVEGSVCRITGETRDSKVDEVAAMLPLRSMNDVKEMEDKLQSDDFSQAALMYVHRLKGTSEDVNSVIRGIFTDDLLEMYNLEGRWEKYSFAKLAICSKILRDVFQSQPELDFKKSVRKAIERSHHRIKQRRYIEREKYIT